MSAIGEIGITVRRLKVGKKELMLDEDGFLQDVEEWTPEVAAALANEEGIVLLTSDHWRIIDFLRDYYAGNGVAPSVRRLVKSTGYSTEEIYKLFPSGPGKGACKVAGLMKPTGCV